MHLLDLTLATPAENLALDEALWEACEAGGPERLRFWEPSLPFVVLGYANRIATEVNVEACRQRGIPVLRRVSGGGTVLQGPGCLNYTLVFCLAATGPTANVSATNLYIMNRHATALAQALDRPVRRRGDTDLAIGDQKFSGNAQRRGRHALLFHGTVLCHGDLELMEAVLPPPSRQPEYRVGRSHASFVSPLGVPPERVKDTLRRAWQAGSPFTPSLSRPTGEGVGTLTPPLSRPTGKGVGTLTPSLSRPTGEGARRAGEGAAMAVEQVQVEQGAFHEPTLSAALGPHSLIARARELARTKYETHAWTFRF